MGRTSKFTTEMRLMIGRKVSEKEMTYKEAQETFGVSQGAIGSYIKQFKNQTTYDRRNERNHERSAEIINYRHQGQVKELKQQIADLFLENQMLKKILNKSLEIKDDNGSVITTENLAQSQEDAK